MDRGNEKNTIYELVLDLFNEHDAYSVDGVNALPVSEVIKLLHDICKVFRDEYD